MRTVLNSSNVNALSSITLIKCLFTDFMLYSQMQPKYGNLDGMKCQLMPECLNSRVICALFFVISSCNCCNALFVFEKLIALSEYVTCHVYK